jgi:hypothetical protein
VHHQVLPHGVAELLREVLVDGELCALGDADTVGRGLPDEIIAELDRVGVPYRVNGTTPHGGNELRRVCIVRPPDHLDALHAHPSMVTSWKRFAITILKNDHTCKYLGLAPTQEQQARQKQIQAKYSSLNNTPGGKV